MGNTMGDTGFAQHETTYPMGGSGNPESDAGKNDGQKCKKSMGNHGFDGKSTVIQSGMSWLIGKLYQMSHVQTRGFDISSTHYYEVQV